MALSQDQLASLVNPFLEVHCQKHMKDLPILLPQLDHYTELTSLRREKLSIVDSGRYAESAAVALQFPEGVPGFYLIPTDTYRKKYKEVKVEEVAKKNGKFFSIAACGMSKSEELKIHAPRGEQQTKKADTEAFIVKEEGAVPQFYLIQVDSVGQPDGYLPLEEC